MSRRVEWLAGATDDLMELSDIDLAAAVDAAVKIFALSAVGTVLRLPNLAGADEHRLYVPPDHRYYARIRYTADVVYVERVLRSP